MLGKEQAVPEHLIGPKELDFTIQPHDVSCTALAIYSCTAGEGCFGVVGGCCVGKTFSDKLLKALVLVCQGTKLI